MIKSAAIIGGGVIGGGWAARFLLAGWNVRVFDPDPKSVRKIGEVLENARRSLPGLSDVAPPPEGKLIFCESLEQAVRDASWVQESVPEKLELKQQVYQQIQSFAAKIAIVASSTSGFKPSQLQDGAIHPENIMVAHPFNPVYLLPLVELVAGDKAKLEHIQSAKDTLTEIGMYPLHVRNEIDAHIADRFLEAVWREALWLVNDGIATTEEIDNAIRYGFGIRWAQMGLFETYRVAGGEAGMKHFLAQFGPCLKWPWTKLTDVPELTDELINQIATQSDAQSGQHSIRELERIRDNNLVAMLRALKAQNSGAGALLADHDKRIDPRQDETIDTHAPITTVQRCLPLDWTDYNGHMNESRYGQIYSDATDRFMEIIGAGHEYIASFGSYFTVENHVRFLEECKAGDRVIVDTVCLSGAGKKMHLFHQLKAENGRIVSTGETLLLHVNLETRCSSTPRADVEAKLVEIANAHAQLPRPEGAGRAIGLTR